MNTEKMTVTINLQLHYCVQCAIMYMFPPLAAVYYKWLEEEETTEFKNNKL